MATGIREFYAPSRKAWRTWLKEHGERETSIWLVMYKKNTGKPTVTYEEAVEEALCFGWIDSKANKRTDAYYVLLFAQRNPRSNWSKLNKERVEKLIASRKMTKRGLAAIDVAKQNGRWNALDEVSEGIFPEDLKEALERNQQAKNYFEAFPPSARKGILEWILNAKTEATRRKRIAETVTLAARNERANQYKRPA